MEEAVMEQQLQKQKQPWKKLEEEEEEEEEEQVASLSRRTNGHTHHTNGVKHEVEAESDETSATTAPTAAATSFPVEEEQNEGDEASSKLHKNSVYLDSHQGNESVNGDSVIVSTTDVESLPSKAKELDTERKSEIEENENGIEEGFTEVHVETVIEKQTTHDIICPNCRSCITKRVILRRKRRATRERQEPEPEKRLRLETDPDDEGSQQKLFRCLECFSYFIPKVGCFDMFRPSEDRNGKNWFSSLFKPDNTTAAQGQGAGATTQDTNNCPVALMGNTTPSKNAKLTEVSHLNSLQGSTKEPSLHSDHVMYEPTWPLHLTESSYSQALSKGSANESLENGMKRQISSTEDYGSHLNSLEGSTREPSLHGDHVIDKPTEASHPIASSYSQGLGKGPTTGVSEEGKKPTISSPHKYGSNKLVPMPWEKLNDPVITSGSEHKLDIPEQQGGQATIPSDGNPFVTDVLPSPRFIGAQESESHPWDILKSIVYGGLGESITSLSIVSSAAAGGATTLNVLALGLANVIGGLFMLAHNLREVKNEEEHRYEQLLGWKRNFWRHALTAVLSFIIFGLIPPIVYGFAFRKSDETDFKIAAVAGSSLACIMLLAIGKGHIQRSYIKTVLYYVTIAFAASGVSYAVGDLAKSILEKYGWFESGVAFTVPFPERNLNPAATWASY